MSRTQTIIAALTLVLTGAGCTANQTVETIPAPFSVDQPSLAAVERGRVMAAAKCGGCHAVGTTGDSPLAAAPPLRVIANLYPPSQLQEAFGEGITTGHTAMPQFAFSPTEITDLIAYLDTLRTP